MRDFHAPWAIAGGWAIALFVGHPVRSYADIDVAILRTDQQRLWTELRPRVAKQVIAGVLRDWRAGDWLMPPVHEIYLTWADGCRLEFLLNEHDPAAGDWVYRRDPRVRRELSRAFVNVHGIPCLAPEIVLLYKSKAPRTQDETDFATALPHLDLDRRRWLHAALANTAPGHPWARIVTREA